MHSLENAAASTAPELAGCANLSSPLSLCALRTLFRSLRSRVSLHAAIIIKLSDVKSDSTSPAAVVARIWRRCAYARVISAAAACNYRQCISVGMRVILRSINEEMFYSVRKARAFENSDSGVSVACSIRGKINLNSTALYCRSCLSEIGCSKLASLTREGPLSTILSV